MGLGVGVGSGDITLEPPPPPRRRAARWMARAARVCRRASSNHDAAVAFRRCGTACGLDGGSRFCRSSRRRAAAARACAAILACSRLAAVAAALSKLPELARSSALLSRAPAVLADLEKEEVSAKEGEETPSRLPLEEAKEESPA